MKPSWELRKFNKEIDALRALGREPEEHLNTAESDRLKSKILTSVNNISLQKPQEKMRWGLVSSTERLVRYVVSLLLGLSLAGGTSFASSSALPGDTLYGIKRIMEKVELQIASSEEYKAQIKSSQAHERLREVEQIFPTAESDRPVSEFETQTKADAGVEISKAIEALKKAEESLLTQGKTVEANAMQAQISHLKSKAQTLGISIE